MEHGPSLDEDNAGTGPPDGPFDLAGRPARQTGRERGPGPGQEASDEAGRVLDVEDDNIGPSARTSNRALPPGTEGVRCGLGPDCHASR